MFLVKVVVIIWLPCLCLSERFRSNALIPQTQIGKRIHLLWKMSTCYIIHSVEAIPTIYSYKHETQYDYYMI